MAGNGGLTIRLNNNGSHNKKEVAERTGLEPATPGVTGRYSNQLNYRSVVLLLASSPDLKTLPGIESGGC